MSEKQKKARKTSLTNKIMLFFMVPIALGMTFFMTVLWFSVKADKEHSAEILVDLMAKNIMDRIGEYSGLVEALSQDDAVLSMDYTKAEPFLQRFMQRNSDQGWSHFLLTDSHGVNFAHTEGAKDRGVSIADRSYFTVPWTQNKTEIAEPTFSKSTGRKILAIGTPITVNGKNEGVLVGFIQLNFIAKIINEFLLTKNSFNFILNDKGVVMAHPNDEIVLVQNWFKPDEKDESSKKYIASMHPSFKKTIVDITAGKTGVTFAWVNGIYSMIFFTRIGLKTLSLVSVAPVLEVFEVFIVLFSLLGVMFIVLAAVSIVIGKSIVKPIKNITEALPEIASGDFTKQLKITGNDEIAELSTYFNQTIAKIRDSLFEVKNETVVMNTIGTKLSSNASTTASAVHEITSNIESVKSQVINEAAGVEQTQATIEQIIKNIEKLTKDIEKQAHSITDATAATEEMVANVRSVTQILARNTQEVTSLSDAAQKGRESLEQTTTVTQKISDESEGLLEASSIIENIAAQTNLLAMNAAIEAAHAGDAGKGFAVVADEIRKLAEDSSSQSKSITNVLKKLKDDIENLSVSAGYVQNQFNAIYDLTQSVKRQEETVTNMMQEQGTANEQVLKSMQLISQITANVQEGSAVMHQGSKEIGVEMEKLAQITAMINGSMTEMVTGTQEINKATSEVSTISQQNSDSIKKVSQNIAKFKL